MTVGIEMWFKDDIANILSGIEQASEQKATDRDSDQYSRGFRAAIAAVARTFGIKCAQNVSRETLQIDC